MDVVNRLKTKRVDSKIGREQAENVAVMAFSFLAAEPEYFSRFCGLTGINYKDISEISGSREFLASVLEYYLGDEPLLLSFCQNNQLPPETIKSAHLSLTGNMYLE